MVHLPRREFDVSWKSATDLPLEQYVTHHRAYFFHLIENFGKANEIYGVKNILLYGKFRYDSNILRTTLWNCQTITINLLCSLFENFCSPPKFLFWIMPNCSHLVGNFKSKSLELPNFMIFTRNSTREKSWKNLVSSLFVNTHFESKKRFCYHFIEFYSSDIHLIVIFIV